MDLNFSENEKQTGKLFGELFSAFDNDNYKRSVQLFQERFKQNDFDLNDFKGKVCLDIGCGGGRYSIALSQLGAKSVLGVDISEVAIEDAKARVGMLNIKNVDFINYSGEELPIKSNEYDIVIMSGVLMHMDNPSKGLLEAGRVLRKDGMIYMLVYATEGLRWPLISMLRNISSFIGFKQFDMVLSESGLDVNKRRTYLDDLFVPNIDFYSWNRLNELLLRCGFHKITRWEKGKLDHEESLDAYYQDMFKLTELFITGASSKNLKEDIRNLFKNGVFMCQSVLNFVDLVNKQVAQGNLTNEDAVKLTIGQGHHRLIAYKR